MQVDNILLSVIVPIYDIEDYVEKCITSIINSTYKRIEIILVDDGSKDSSGEICDKYAKEDSRIIVIHKKNGGLVSARKAGVEIAKGDYVLFVDGDDYIEPELINDLCDFAMKNEAEMVSYSDSEYEGGKKIVNKNVDLDGRYVTSEYIHRISERNSGLTISHDTGKLFKTDYIRKGISFVDNGVTKGEDLIMTMVCLRMCKVFWVKNAINGYIYVNRPTSLTHSYDEDSIEHTANAVRNLLKLCYNNKLVLAEKEWDKLIYHEAYNLILSDCIGCTFLHYGKLRMISIAKYFKDMTRNDVFHAFFKQGIENGYFIEERKEFAKLMSEGDYLGGLIYRIRKKVS